MKDPAGDDILQQLVTGLQDKDIGKIEALCTPELIAEKDQLYPAVTQLFSYYEGTMTSWEKTDQKTSTVTTQEGTVKRVESQYKVTTDKGSYIITIGRVELPSGESGLYGFHVVSEKDRNFPTGYLADWNKFNALQWLLTVMGFASYIFVAFTVFHCIKHKMRRKPLFIIAALFHAGIGITKIPGLYNITFLVNTLNKSSLLIYSQGGSAIIVMLPVGAAFYWLLHKKFLKKDLIEQTPESAFEVSSEPPSDDSPPNEQ